MTRLKIAFGSELLLVALILCATGAQATDIGGPISTTLTITEDSKLVGDVACTVTGAPCIAFGASGLTLDLNGYSLNGLADPQAPCGSPGPNEAGILVNSFNNVVIRGPGVVQQFRNFGIQLQNSTGATVTGVTMSSNCASGVIVIGGSDHLLEGNVSVRNGAPNAPCGGI
jgi:hypothetical protein